MAIAFDAAAKATPVSGTGITWNHTLGGSANCLTVFVLGDGFHTGSTATCTAGGVSMTSVAAKDWVGAWSGQMFVLKAPPTGLISIVVTGASASYSAYSKSFTGVDQTTPNRTALIGDDGGSGAVSPAQVIVSNALNGDMVVDGAMVDTTTMTVGGSQTTDGGQDNNPLGNGFSTGSSRQSATGSTTMQWTFTGTQFWFVIGVALVPAAAASTGYVLDEPYFLYQPVNR